MTFANVAPGRGFSDRALYGADGLLTWGVGLQTRSEDLPMGQLIGQHRAGMSEEERDRLFPRGVTDAVATELWEFVQSVQGKGENETDGVEGLKALAIGMAVYESSWLGEPVEVAKVERCEMENYQADPNEAAGVVSHGTENPLPDHPNDSA